MAAKVCNAWRGIVHAFWFTMVLAGQSGSTVVTEFDGTRTTSMYMHRTLECNIACCTTHFVMGTAFQPESMVLHRALLHVATHYPTVEKCGPCHTLDVRGGIFARLASLAELLMRSLGN